MANIKYTPTQIKMNNEKAAKAFRDLVYADVRLLSINAFMATQKRMVRRAVEMAEYSNYSGTLIRSYMAVNISKHLEKIKVARANRNFEFAKGYKLPEDVSKDIKVIERHYNEINPYVYTSDELPTSVLGSEFVHAVKVSGGKTKENVKLPPLYLKMIQRRRNPNSPEAILSNYDTHAKDSDVEMMYNRKQYVKETMTSTIEDSVVLTNTAPYAEIVHRNWNRVLPGNLPEWSQRFYVRIMRKSIEKMRSK